MSAAQTTSEHYRKNGNAHFGTAKTATTASDKRLHLWSALDSYKASLSTAATAEDRSLCWKNSAVAHRDLCLLEWGLGNRVRAWDHLHGSLDAFSEAWRHASAWPGAQEWSARFAHQFPADLRVMYSLTLSLETDQCLVDNLGRVCDRIGRYGLSNSDYVEVAVNIFIDWANRLLHLSVTLDKKLHYGLAYSYIAKMHFPIREADKLLKRNSTALDCLDRELETLREDQRIQETVFHARVELERGKSFLQNLGQQGAADMMDEALLAMDHLRAALNLISTDGIDIALEAEVCSSIGDLYLSFFKSESWAEKFLKRSVELVLCFLPGDLQAGCRTETWFATAERGLRNLQELQAKRRDDERLKELEADGTLRDIKDSYAKGIDHFLEHVYKKYPPPVADKKLPVASKPLKTRLKVALMHFHPDKVPDKQDRRWFYICEEITKCLNLFYEINVKQMATEV